MNFFSPYSLHHPKNYEKVKFKNVSEANDGYSILGFEYVVEIKCLNFLIRLFLRQRTYSKQLHTWNKLSRNRIISSWSNITMTMVWRWWWWWYYLLFLQRYGLIWPSSQSIFKMGTDEDSLKFWVWRKENAIPCGFLFYTYSRNIYNRLYSKGLAFPPKNSNWQPKAKCTYIGMNISRNTYVI